MFWPLSLMHRADRKVLDKAITYVGLDVHKETIAVALAEAGVLAKKPSTALEAMSG